MTDNKVAFNELAKENKIKIGIEAFNDLAVSHDAHVKEVERLTTEVKSLHKELEHTKNTLKSAVQVIQEVVVQLNKQIM